MEPARKLIVEAARKAAQPITQNRHSEALDALAGKTTGEDIPQGSHSVRPKQAKKRKNGLDPAAKFQNGLKTVFNYLPRGQKKVVLIWAVWNHAGLYDMICECKWAIVAIVAIVCITRVIRLVLTSLTTGRK